MPIYEFKCVACNSEFEELCKSSETVTLLCPKCGKTAKRKVASKIALQFKGTGFYITDYAKKSSSLAPNEKPSNSTDSSTNSKETVTKKESKKASNTDKKD